MQRIGTVLQYKQERNVFRGNQIDFDGTKLYLEGMKCIWREQNLFVGNDIYLEGTKSIWRERNLFGGNDADFERTKCILRE